jgi:hypothetical protein
MIFAIPLMDGVVARALAELFVGGASPACFCAIW